MNHRATWRVLRLAGLSFAFVGTTFAQVASRNYDARQALSTVSLVDDAAMAQLPQADALSSMQAQIPSLMATIDERTGVTSSMFNPVGFLTAPRPGADPVEVARSFVADSTQMLGLAAPGQSDASNFELQDLIETAGSGAHHVYLRQHYRGLEVYNGQVHVNVSREGAVLGVNNSSMPQVASALNTMTPRLDALRAVGSAARHLGVVVEPALVATTAKGRDRLTEVSSPALSREPIWARLMILPVHHSEARLVWNFQLHTLDGQHVFDLTVDAVTGDVWTRFDWVAGDQYRVYEAPSESPTHAAGRTLVVDPAESTASPLGWQDTGSNSFTNLRGNNVHAYDDADANNAPPSSQPDCGANLNCDFPLNLNQSPSSYRAAAVTNLFYWNNWIHDVQYQYGFDEAAGNFQVNNFGRGGRGGDYVRAEAQDGGGTNNANMFTPPDGQRPRMQMFVWNQTNPARDGDFDNGIVVHEYGHGISIRQVGGPSNSSCLNNDQQMGEGWSDFFALVYTARFSDQGSDPRGVGTYVLGQPESGSGIRTQRYSTDPSINTHTYESIRTARIPHGVGEVWAQVLWEAYWALVDKYGFDSNLADPTAAAGNHRALLYVNEGLKNTACSPTFVNARDAIIQAAIDNFNGEDVCLLWEVFAKFGLGTDALSGGPNNTNVRNGFQKPATCSCTPLAIANAGADKNICVGQTATIGTPTLPGHRYLWNPGGATAAQILVAPAQTTVYNLSATTVCGTAQDQVTVFVDPNSSGGLNETFEGDVSSWSTSGLWHRADNSACANPAYSSPTNAFYFGRDEVCDFAGTSFGTLVSPLIDRITAQSTLNFQYLRRVEAFAGPFDKTEVDIIAESGQRATVFALDSSTPSEGRWKPSGAISLAAFAGQPIRVSFRFDSVDNISNNFAGWFIDDVVVTGSGSCAGNRPPTVTILSPTNGSTGIDGRPINFVGLASDPEDGALDSGLNWTSNRDGVIGTGASFSRALSAGAHTITASVADSAGLSGIATAAVSIAPPSGVAVINWNDTATVSYSNQDAGGDNSIEDSGATLRLTGNTWRRTVQGFELSAFTVLEFEFQSTAEGEIHGIGFDQDDILNNDIRIFQLYGTQAWTGANHLYDGETQGGFVTYRIPVGAFYRGTDFHLVLVNDKDAGAGTHAGRFRNVRIYELGDSAPTVDFSQIGLTGYSNQDASGTLEIGPDGDTVSLNGNKWQRSTEVYELTTDTVVAFEFSSTSEGEIHGLGLDEDDVLTNALRIFRIHGTQNWTGDLDWSTSYSGSGAAATFVVPVGRFYTGSGFRLVLTNDDDAGANAQSTFGNLRLYELK